MPFENKQSTQSGQMTDETSTDIPFTPDAMTSLDDEKDNGDSHDLESSMQKSEFKSPSTTSKSDDDHDGGHLDKDAIRSVTAHKVSQDVNFKQKTALEAFISAPQDQKDKLWRKLVKTMKEGHGSLAIKSDTNQTLPLENAAATSPENASESQASSFVPQLTPYSVPIRPEINYSETSAPMPPEYIGSCKIDEKVNAELHAANFKQSHVLEVQEDDHEPKPPEFAALSADDEKDAFKKQAPNNSNVGAQFVNMSSSSATSEKEKKMEKKVDASPNAEVQPTIDEEQGESSFKNERFSTESKDEELGDLVLRDQSKQSIGSTEKTNEHMFSDRSLVSKPDDISAIDDDFGNPRYLLDTPSFTEDGIAIAKAIDDTNEDDNNNIHLAVEYDPDAKAPLYQNRKCQAGTILALVIISIVVAVSVVYGTKKTTIVTSPEEVEYVTLSPTLSPTSPPTTERETRIKAHIEARVLERNATFQKMAINDPRVLALDWILNKDLMELEEFDDNLSQRYTLALVAFSLDSLAWKNCGNYTAANTCYDLTEEYSVWLSSADECEWYGVTCIDDSVQWVELSKNGLIGEIPPELSALPNLRILDFSANCLYGTLPSEIGKLSNLVQLELSQNALSGLVPNEIFDASNLQKLDLAFQIYNSWNCTRSDGSVVEVYYSKGDPENSGNWGLEGEICDARIGKLQNLTQLLLNDNYFSGSIASEIGKLEQLAFLNVENNVMSRLIPVEMTELKNLQQLWLSVNYLSGGLPETIGHMESLESLSVWGNENMTGIIPDSLYNLTKLRVLYLHSNLFSGTISEEIGNLKKLKALNLAYNSFSGTLPTEVGLCEELEILQIQATDINGSVPEEVCLLTTTYNLNSEDEDIEYFKADCSPDNETFVAFFSCGCCNTCCDHTTGQCIINK